MASIKEIRNRIKSVQNTKKITRAMEMVAAAKLRRLEDMLGKSDNASNFIEYLLKRLVGTLDNYENPLLEKRENEDKIALVIFTSDTGLCGTYNSNVLHETNAFLKENSGKDITVIAVGKTGATYFGKDYEVVKVYSEIRFNNLEENLKDLGDLITNGYIDSTYDAVYFSRTKAITKSTSKAIVEKFLGFEVEQNEEDETSNNDIEYILEPSAERIVEALIPEYLSSKVRRALIEAMLAEQVSRMVAMHQATENAQEMIGSLTLLRNKLRQAAITTELTEIVSGAKALEQ